MASDAKPESPPAADPPADDAKDADPEPEEEEEKEEEEGEEGEKAAAAAEPQSGRKRGRRKKGEADRPEKASPATPTVERPSRERKTVERYSELAPRVTPAKKSPAILQGSGSKLKDIPNVSFKLSKRKVDENLQSLHVLMYGKKSNVHFLKRNISQFSGFVWTDNQEKHRARIKEKLDKNNKEKLLDFCEILDIHVSKTTTKKEEVSAKLLEFLESPCITRDVVLTDEKKGKKRRRRSKGSGKETAEGASEEKKRRKPRKQSIEAAKENDDEDDGGPAGSEDASMGEEDDEDSEAKDNAGSDEEPDEPPAKKKSIDDKQTKKAKEKDASGKKSSTKPVKGVSKPDQDPEEDEPDVELESKKVDKKASKNLKESDGTVHKVNKKVSKSRKDDGKEGQKNNSGASNNKARKKEAAKASNKNKGKGKGSTEVGTAPTTEELHAVVSDILKEVDFNTYLTLPMDIFTLGTHFKMDLMDRKSEVKHIIEEVINSMSDDEEGEEENAEEDVDKEENSKDDADGGGAKTDKQVPPKHSSCLSPLFLSSIHERMKYGTALHWTSSSDSYQHGETTCTPVAFGFRVQEEAAAVVVELGVKRGEPSLVAPAEETTKGAYFLSNLDQNIAVIVQTVYCFTADGADACAALRGSLSRVLVHYYPLAGRLAVSGEGKLIVDCTGEGAVFVDAEADCAMADIGDITRPDPSVLGELVYSVPGAKNVLEMPLLAAQARTRHKLISWLMVISHLHPKQSSLIIYGYMAFRP
ncbi:hypothetical protein ABZP36_027891 [Zizania latifolia]